MSGSNLGPSPCRVCGFAELRTDEVLHDGVLFLRWCPRCDHRVTSRTPGLRPASLEGVSDAHVRAA